MAAPFNLATGSSSAAGPTSTGVVRLMGWSVFESAGSPAAAKVVFHDGVGTSGAIIGNCVLAASGEKTQWLGPQGILCVAGGIYVERVAGSTTVTLWYE